MINSIILYKATEHIPFGKRIIITHSLHWNCFFVLIRALKYISEVGEREVAPNRTFVLQPSNFLSAAAQLKKTAYNTRALYSSWKKV